MEIKIRRVRTPEGRERFGQEIGEVIVPGSKPQQLTIPRVGKPKIVVGVRHEALSDKIEKYIADQYGIEADDYNVRGQLKDAVAERILAGMKDVPTDDLVYASSSSSPQNVSRALRLDLLDPNNKAWEQADGYGLYDRRTGINYRNPTGPRPGDIVEWFWGDLYIRSADEPRSVDPFYDQPMPKYATVGTPEAEHLLRLAAVSDLIATWAMSSNDTNPISLALQDCAKDLFGLQDTQNWGRANENMLRQRNGKNRRVYNAFLEAQYMATQHMFMSWALAECVLIAECGGLS